MKMALIGSKQAGRAPVLVNAVEERAAFLWWGPTRTALAGWGDMSDPGERGGTEPHGHQSRDPLFFFLPVCLSLAC